MSLEGRVLGGRYKLYKHLADGGMGAIWSAQHLTLGMPVAVKLMSVEGAMRRDLRVRFEREAKAVALLRNPHIVQVLDYGTDDDTPFIVMELLEGIDLLGTQKDTERWPLSEIGELVRQVAQGLAAAHRVGLIHRDVKPANIFLARSDEQSDVVAKLIDFGISKWTDDPDALTGANVVLGSPSYMSPEQVRGQRLDARVDAWSLAVVAYALVTGAMPFVGRTGPDIARQVVLGIRRKVEPPTPNAFALERFFARALAVDAAARFRSIEELAGEFILVTGAPSPLRTAARFVAAVSADTTDQNETQQIPKYKEDSVTNLFVKSCKVEALLSDSSSDLEPGDLKAPADPEDPETFVDSTLPRTR